jgi:ribose-phosphate pyrophosphokinase
VLAGDAIKNLKFAPIDTIILSDTINIPKKKHLPNMIFVSVAPLIADAISAMIG